MKKIILKLIFWILIILIITCSIFVGLGYLKYKDAINNIPLQDKIQELKNENNYTKLEDISQIYINAVIATEDHRFYEHNGIDCFSIFRSTFVNIKRKSFDLGASTITQQVRKALIFFSRKIIY